MSQLAFNIHWNPKEVGSKAGEGIDWPVENENKQANRIQFPLCPLYKLTAEGMAQIEGGSCQLKKSEVDNYHLRDPDQKQVFSLQTI